MYLYPDFASVSGCVCEQPLVGNLLPGSLLPSRLAGKMIDVLPILDKSFRLFPRTYDWGVNAGHRHPFGLFLDKFVVTFPPGGAGTIGRWHWQLFPALKWAYYIFSLLRIDSPLPLVAKPDKQREERPRERKIKQSLWLYQLTKGWRDGAFPKEAKKSRPSFLIWSEDTENVAERWSKNCYSSSNWFSIVEFLTGLGCKKISVYL